MAISPRAWSLIPRMMHPRSAFAILILAGLLAGCSGAATSSPTQTPARSGAKPTATTRPKAKTPTSTAGTASIPVDAERATVDWITDGDTMDITLPNGDEESVRLIGLDAPEVHPTTNEPRQCFADDATRILISLAKKGTRIWLERDVSDRDRFGRLVRYVWIERGGEALLLNLELVRRGAGIAYPFEPDTSREAEFKQAEREAKANDAGLWGACGGIRAAGESASVNEGDPAFGITAARDGCDPAYPTVCIPSPPPDLDCPQITFARFQVLPPDPHRFDLDFDGIGCEGAPP